MRRVGGFQCENGRAGLAKKSNCITRDFGRLTVMWFAVAQARVHWRGSGQGRNRQWVSRCASLNKTKKHKESNPNPLGDRMYGRWLNT